MKFSRLILTANLLLVMMAHANSNLTTKMVEISQMPIKIATPTLPNEPISTTNYYTPDQESISLFEIIKQATLKKDHVILTKYLPQYQALEDADPIAIDYARAVLFEKQGELKKAIAIYRQILAKDAQLTPIRFELAKVLYDDKQNEASKDQFHKVLSDNPPPFVVQLSNLYLKNLQKQSRLQTTFTLNYLQEDNINNANHDPNIADTLFTKGQQMKPKSAEGVSYSLGLQKDFNVKHNHYLAIENELFGKHYWSEQDYNDLFNRTSVGYRYQDEKQRFAILPFYEKRWYGNESYKSGTGVRGEYSQWVTPSWQIASAVEYGDHRHKKNTTLDGKTYLASATTLWLQNPKRYLYAGLDVNKDDVQDKHQASTTTSVRFGVGQEWGKGISSRVGMTVGRRVFDDTAVVGGIIPLDTIRKDTEYRASITLWKRDWHWLGVTPKITHAYKRVDSNIPSVYSYDQHQTYVSFEKTF